MPHYELYGLPGRNPYAPQVLDPLSCPADFDELLELGGFVSIDPIRAHLRAAVDRRRPAFVVVSGRDRTGRTSVANCILHLFQQLQERPGPFLVARVPVSNHDDREWLGRALAQLGNEADFAEIDLSPGTLAALGALGDAGDLPFEERCQAAAFKVARDLGRLDPPGGFGVLFEGIRTDGLIAAARRVFDRTPGAVLFTHASYEHSQTTLAGQIDAATLDDAVHLVTLRPLAAAQINELADRRWSAASPHACPYDPAGIDEVYRNRPAPIKAALYRLARLLDYRLRTTGDEERGPWPDNERLGMSRRWLVETVALLDEQPPF